MTNSQQPPAEAVRVDVVVPVLNEEKELEPNITTLRAYLKEHCPYRWRIVIADNGSTDRTPEIAKMLEARWPGEVTHFRLEERGRGRALRHAWLASDADIVSYMDVDLSTNLNAFMPLIEPLVRGEYQVAIGSRLKKGARVTRQWKREIISRAYNLLIKLLFPRRRFSDAQCGFKALTREAVQKLVPRVRDQGWFFDSELLLLAEKEGYRIHEVPVEWIEDLDTRVKIIPTAWEDVKGLIRVRLGL
ncbi:MAG: glycosyltransferase family 2 protein [Chloroflexi bacterium]|nr:MAG: glycosyltransferase family 2 protein [Chloroflexota bacterium]